MFAYGAAVMAGMQEIMDGENSWDSFLDTDVEDEDEEAHEWKEWQREVRKHMGQEPEKEDGDDDNAKEELWKYSSCRTFQLE